jgi:hypothetical protein
MANEIEKIGSAAGAVVIVGIFVSLSLSATSTWPQFLQFMNGGAAAWIQAIGSILAILATNHATRRQIAHARLLENDKRLTDEIRRLDVVKALLVRGVNLASDVLKAIETLEAVDLNHVSTKLMLETQRTIDSLPPFEIPSGLLALDLLHISPALADLAKLWQEFADKSAADGGFHIESASIVQAYAKEIREVGESALNDANVEIRARRDRLSAPLIEARNSSAPGQEY